MAAAMNGMALHGGIIPYSGTFLVFSDYCRPAIRLAALMGERVIHVMTHNSIGLGEDGPTHQPVEHLAALRAIPNLNVFRPCDAVETVECWQLALEAPRHAERAGADAAEPAAASAGPRRAQPLRRRRLRDLAGAGQGAGVDLRHRLGGRRSRSRRRSSWRARASRPASSRCRASNCSWPHRRGPPRRDRRCAGQDRRRGRRPAGLGRHHRLRRRCSSA